MASETLRFDLLARDNASKVFDKVGDSASKAESGFSKMGTRLAAVGKMAARGSIVFGGLAAAGGMLGLKTAAGMEQARISFTTMLGSAQKADSFLKQLAAFAAKTPFEFPELQTAASSLISAGFEAKKVIPIMTTLGDVTSGMGTGAEGVKRATVALQQMSAAGRITGEDLNQLRDAGVPVFDLLASATGKSKEAIAALAQEGKLGKREMQALFDALGTGKGLERFNGLMEKQSASLTGMWSTFQDTLGMGLAKAIAPALPAIKDGLARMTGAIGTALAAIPGIVANVKDFAGPIVQRLRDAVPQIKETVGQWRGAVSGFLDGVTIRVEPLIASVRTALDTGNWGPVGQSLGSAISEAIKGAGSAVGQIGSALGGLLSKIDFVGLGIAMGRQAPSVVIGFAAGLLNFDLSGLLRGLWNNWQSVLMAGIAIWLTPVRIIGKVGQMLARIPLVGRLLEWGLNAIKGFVDYVGSAIGHGITFLGSAFLGGFRRVFPGIGSAFGQALQVLPTRIGVAAIEVAERAGELMARFRGAITNRIGSVIAAIGELVGKIVQGLAVLAGKGLSAGMDLVRGFINGIKAMAGAAVDAAADMASAALAKVKSMLKIFSPSRETFALGEFFSQGLADGIKNRKAVVLKAVTGVIANVKDKLKDLRDQAAQIRSTAHEAVMGSLNVGALGQTTTTTDADGNEVSNTARVTDQVASFRANAGAFSAAISEAVSKGVSANLIQQVASLGPTNGLVAAQALAAMNSAEVAQVNRDLALADKFAAQVGSTVLTTTSLPADIAREDAKLAALNAIRDDLRSGRTINFNVYDATDPDKVIAAIRKYIKRNGKLRDVAAD